MEAARGVVGVSVSSVVSLRVIRLLPAAAGDPPARSLQGIPSDSYLSAMRHQREESLGL